VKQQVCGVPSCAALLDKGAVFRGLRLCASCRNLLAIRLASLPQMYQACEQALEVRHQHSIRVVRGRRPTGICLDDETVTVRSNTIGVLSAWCEMIVDERGVPGPGGLDVRKLASFLHAHLDWLSTHSVAADFAEEIAGLAMAFRKVLVPAQERTIDLAPCPQDGCGRMVRVNISTIQRRPGLLVSCDAGHTWQPRQWLDLRRQLDITNCDAFA
jgi:hypothetical protein